MKKFLLSIVLAVTSLTAVAAPSSYVGGTVDFLHTSELDTTLVGVVGGVNLTDSVAVEAKVQQTVDARESTLGNTKVTLATVNAVTTLPLMENVYAKGSVGATWARMAVSGMPTVNSDPALTLGAGLGVNLTKDVAIEANYTFADVRGTSYGVTDSLDTNQFGLAVKYNF